jgi:hypothetical protein
MKKNYIFLACIFSLLSACRVNIDSGLIIDIEKEFNLQLTEKLDSTLNSFDLLITSVKKQDCDNVRVKHAITVVSNRVFVTLKELDRPSNCSGVGEVAHDTVHLGQLTEGVYRVQINLKDAIINQGTLTITPSRAILEMSTENGINVTAPTVMHIPERAIWGGVSIESANIPAMHKFLDTLSNICPIFNESLGNYGHFSFQSANLITIPAFAATKPNVVKFVRILPRGKEIDLQQIINNFKLQYGTNAQVEIWSRYGNKY